MTDMATDLKLELSRVIKAPREKLFDAWLNPDMLARFMLPADNVNVPKAETDPREGGRFLIVMRAGVEGGTEIRLTHVRFPNEESRDNHEAGWGRILNTLAGAV